MSEQKKKFGTVALLGGGDSPEREVSLSSAQMIKEALEKVCAKVIDFDPASRKLSELSELGVDAAFNALHGGAGEDGRIQATLEMMGIPCTGPDHRSCSLAMDKHVAKLIWAHNQLATPEWCLVPKTTEEILDYITLSLGDELFVKPNTGGSSIASRPVDKLEDLVAALAEIHESHGSAIVEQRIGGMELTYSLLGDEILPGIKIEAGVDFYDYDAKYKLDTTRYICPPDIPAEIDEECRELAKKAFDCLGCRKFGRVDMMVAGREPFLLEVNPSPGMTDHSLVPKSAAAAGMDYDALVCKILELAL